MGIDFSVLNQGKEEVFGHENQAPQNTTDISRRYYYSSEQIAKIRNPKNKTSEAASKISTATPDQAREAGR